jgi:hypothetical protein
MKNCLVLSFALCVACFSHITPAQQTLLKQEKAPSPLQVEYSNGIYTAVVAHVAAIPWQGNGACILELTQIPSGQVIRASIVDCEFSNELQAELIARLESASLPYSGFESVFQRKIEVRLKEATP